MERNSFNDYRKPYKARGDFMWGGEAVVISPNLPRLHIGDEIVPIMPGRFRAWLLRLFRRPILPRRFKRGAPIEQERAFRAAGKLFISPRMLAELQARPTEPEKG